MAAKRIPKEIREEVLVKARAGENHQPLPLNYKTIPRTD